MTSIQSVMFPRITALDRQVLVLGELSLRAGGLGRLKHASFMRTQEISGCLQELKLYKSI